MAKITWELFTTTQPYCRGCTSIAHVAQLHAVGTEEHFILHLLGFGVVVRQRGIAVLEVALVGDEQPGSGSVEIFHRISVVPLHAARQQQRQPA